MMGMSKDLIVCQCVPVYVGTHMSEEPKEDVFMTKKEIASRYKVTIGCVDKWMLSKTIPFYKIGRLVRYSPVECDAALQKFHQRARRK